MKTKPKTILVIIVLLWFSPAISNALYQPIGIIRTLVQSTLATVFSDTFDTATPAGGDSPTEADDRMREIKAAVQERENVDHYWPLDGTQVSDASSGEHRKITFQGTISDPTQVASKAHLYMQSDELRYQDDTNTAFDLTSAGNLGSVLTSLVAKTVTAGAGSNFPAVFTSTDATAHISLSDDGTTGGQESVLRRQSDVLTLSSTGGDNRLGTSTASSTDTPRQIADKGYVDDQIAALYPASFPAATHNVTGDIAQTETAEFVATQVSVPTWVICNIKHETTVEFRCTFRALIGATSSPATYAAGTIIYSPPAAAGPDYASYSFFVPKDWYYRGFAHTLQSDSATYGRGGTRNYFEIPLAGN